MEGTIRTIEVWVVDPAQLSNGDTEPRVIAVDGTLMSSQPAEAFALSTALGAWE